MSAELRPETATDHSHTNLSVALGVQGDSGWHASRAGQLCGIDQPLPQELPSQFHFRATAEETGNLLDASTR